MPQMKSAKIQDHFADLTDPRRRDVIYPLINVVVIAICAVSLRCRRFRCHCRVRLGMKRTVTCARFLDLRSGIPSRSLNAILAAIKPAEFEKVSAQFDHSVVKSLRDK